MLKILPFEHSVAEEGYVWQSYDDLYGEDSYLPASHPDMLTEWNHWGDRTVFAWVIAADKFGKGETLVVEPHGIETQGKTRLVRPTEEYPALFHHFAAIDPQSGEDKESQDDILTFFDNCGPLSRHDNVFHEIEYEVRTMRYLIEVWEAISQGDEGMLLDRFPPHPMGGFRKPFADTMMFYNPYRGWNERRRERFKKGQADPVITAGTVIDAAREYLSEAFQDRLDVFSMKTTVEITGNTFALTARPKSLLAAIWYQFATAVCESRQYRKCEVCGIDFEIHQDVNRASKRYCTGACRVKAHRDKKAQAKRSHKAGQSIAEIAAALKTEPETVSKWLIEKGK